MTQGVGVVAVLIAAGNLKDALRQQIAQRVGDVTRIAGIGNRPGQAIDQADATIDGAQHQGAQVRGHLTGAEIGANREARSGREVELFVAVA
jgi:bacterioferritin-associated ferredoxin